MEDQNIPQPPIAPIENQPQPEIKSSSFPKWLIIILVIFIIIILSIGSYFLGKTSYKSVSKLTNVSNPTNIPKAVIANKNKVQISLTEGQTIEVPGTDIEIKAIRVSETCQYAPAPCRDETILQFSHFESARDFTLYIGGETLEGQEASNIEIFFGHRIELTSLKGKLITLSIEIPKEISGTLPDWLIYKNSAIGFELQYPKIFELRDWGKSSTGYDYSLGIWTAKSQILHILIYNNVSLSLDEFANQCINGYRGLNSISVDTKPVKFSLSNKELREVISKGLEESKELFWLDSSRQKGVRFVFNTAYEPKIQEDFYEIIKSFKFIDQVSPTLKPGIACIQEAKLCPDGKTYVFRIEPKCEFTPCP